MEVQKCLKCIKLLQFQAIIINTNQRIKHLVENVLGEMHARFVHVINLTSERATNRFEMIRRK